MTGRAAVRAAWAWPGFDEPTLDQLLAEPIVQQLMRRDRTDAATIRQMLQEAAASRPASPAKDDRSAG